MNILVSGVAGDIGLGVGRILRDWSWPGERHGIDIQTYHAGSCIFDHCGQPPRASNENYLGWLEKYISQHDIRYFIPTSEDEIRILTLNKIQKIATAEVLVANPLTVMKSLDKYTCLEYLSSLGVQVPANGIVGETKPEIFPVIVKPRSGQGSKGIRKIESENEFNALDMPNLIWQEYLTPDDEEYTCAVFRCKGEDTRILLLKRKLNGDCTGSGQVIENQVIEKYVKTISDIMDLDGVMNIQLRLTTRGPLLFEINPRLSSTLVFRDKLGFQDLRWWLLDKLGRSIPEYQPPKTGIRFYRGAQEYIIDNCAVQDR